MSDPRSSTSPSQPAVPAEESRPTGESDWHFEVGTRGAPRGRRPKGRRLVRGLLVLALLAVVFVAVTTRVQTNQYVLTPGDAQPVAPLITVPPGHSHHLTGTILLTDVYISQLTVWQQMFGAGANAQVVPADEVVDPGTSGGELVAQGFVEMQQAQDAARAAAFTRLGYPVAAHNGGVQIVGVVTDSPAERILTVGDVVTAVNGTSTPDYCSFSRQLHGLSPGDVVRLSVQPVTYNSNGTPINGTPTIKVARLAAAPKGQQPSGCPGLTTPNRAMLGVEAQTDVVFHFPFHVGLNPNGIGGPSAGLAMTLGIIDQLTGGRLAHGVIAATGTMDPQQNVGEVGGVPQKTVAVESAGATLFMVPPGNYGDALSKDSPSLRVCKVSTLGQALGDLAHFGGHVAASLHPDRFDPRSCN